MPPISEERIRAIIHEELEELLASDRYIFHRTIQILDGRNVIMGTANGTKLGTETTQKLGIWNATPVARTNPTGVTAGFTDSGAGTAVTEQDTFSGNLAGQVYTIGDIVEKLKLIGILA